MLEAQSLTFSYQDKIILDDFSLTLEKGSSNAPTVLYPSAK